MHRRRPVVGLSPGWLMSTQQLMVVVVVVASLRPRRIDGGEMHFSLLLAPFIVCLGSTIEIGDDLSFQLDLIKHQPCNRGPSKCYYWLSSTNYEGHGFADIRIHRFQE
ncbi:unnamed protein product [Haemonchus placei]|uniref:Secreted protein n=1 Tax=Haemonchus placei TaxID=6290 RepID=A0A0N4X703_HAEPC|nr:unnamed protein product [Haemonchus placei]